MVLERQEVPDCQPAFAAWDVHLVRVWAFSSLAWVAGVENVVSRAHHWPQMWAWDPGIAEVENVVVAFAVAVVVAVMDFEDPVDQVPREYRVEVVPS